MKDKILSDKIHAVVPSDRSSDRDEDRPEVITPPYHNFGLATPEDDKGYSALHHACLANDKALVAELIQQGEAIDQEADNGDTPLICAARSSQGEATALWLLAHGANPFLVNHEGETALHHAARQGYYELACALVKKRALINQRDAHGRTPLFEAARAPDGGKTALWLLNRGADPKIPDVWHETTLVRACGYGHRVLVDALLEQGLSVNEWANGDTPLHAAVRGGNEELAFHLLEQGADPKGNGQPALRMACDRELWTLAAALIEKGARINARDWEDDESIIRIAARSEQGEQTALLLLENGALVSDWGEEELVFELACSMGHRDLVVALIERAEGCDQSRLTAEALSIAACSPRGEQLAIFLVETGGEPDLDTLLEACAAGHKKLAAAWIEKATTIGPFDLEQALRSAASSDKGEEVALWLLEQGTNPDYLYDRNCSVLHAACQSGHLGLVTALLEKGVDVNQEDAADLKALMQTVKSERVEEAVSLLKKVATTDLSFFYELCHCGSQVAAAAWLESAASVDANDLTVALKEAASSTAGEATALWLLEQGANPHFADNQGRSILHFASKLGHKDLIKALMEKGVCINQQDSDGQTALMWAAQSNSEKGEDVAVFLLDQGADPHLIDNKGLSALHHATCHRQMVTMNKLIDEGLEIDRMTLEGETPLMVAARLICGHDVVLLLLKRGADPQITDERGDSALHLAAYLGHTSTTAWLIDQGAAIDQCNNDGQTPLILATLADQGETALLLIEKGAKQDVIDVHGYTPLDYAKMAHDLTLINILKDKKKRLK